MTLIYIAVLVKDTATIRPYRVGFLTLGTPKPYPPTAEPHDAASIKMAPHRTMQDLADAIDSRREAGAQHVMLELQGD